MPKKHYTEAPPDVLACLKKNAGRSVRDDLAWWTEFARECKDHEYLVRASDIPMQAAKTLPAMREKARRDPSWAHTIPQLEAQAKREEMLFSRLKETEETWGQEPSPEERAFAAKVEERAQEILAEQQRQIHELASQQAAKELAS